MARRITPPHLYLPPIFVIVQALKEYGCEDLTSRLHSETLSAAQAIFNGGYGNIYTGILDRRYKVAIKALRVSTGPGDEADVLPKRAARELYTWSRCSNRNVLPLLGLAVIDNQIRMVSWWMDNGDLPGYLSRNPDVDRLDMCTQISQGLQYIHGLPMIHGDLKGPNVLVSDTGVPMITDFGNAVLEYGTVQFTKTAQLPGFTVRWTAPELLMSEDFAQSKEADVYALGMTILEVMSGKVPFANQKHEIRLIAAIVTKNLTPDRPEAEIPTGDERSDRLWTLLGRCWSSEPAERPSASEVAETMAQIMAGKAEDPITANAEV
ncbi:Tyrosine-protein kinase [Ceratobasidium sp. AG-Ba]|nr:Tyrosine-protein kinase [Ceratobasidium sp. AG-Ba]